MSYAKSVLQPGETIVAMGRLHWIGFWPAILFLVCGIALASWLYARGVHNLWIALAAVTFGGLFLVFFLRAWIDRWITELAITNHRIIYKRGFIRRHTAEMNMDKVESVNVVQSILGRLLDYGTIHIKGTGQGFERLHDIASPIELRNTIIAK
jgi:uncharacterized membrane protein YdbT with pleckstrin-like domain